MHEIMQTEYGIAEVLDVAKSRMGQGIVTVNLERTGGRYSDCFAYVVEGGCQYTFSDGRVCRVTAGDVMYLAKGDRYLMEVPGGGYSPIFVDFHWVRKTKPLQGEPILLRNPERVGRLFQKLRESWLFQSRAYRIVSLGILYEIYGEMMEQAGAGYLPKSKALKLEKAREMMAEDYADSTLSVHRLAWELSMSEGHFRRLFKTAYGCAPMDFLKNLRIGHAKDLLLSTDLSVSQISFRVGFEDAAYFSRVFKAETLHSPLQYRKRYQKGL